jgi:hypothetical protein
MRIRAVIVAFGLLASGCNSSAPAVAVVSTTAPAAPAKIGTVQTLADGATVQVISEQQVTGYADGTNSAAYLAVQARVCLKSVSYVSNAPWATRDAADNIQAPQAFVVGVPAGMTPYPVLSPVMQAGECAKGWLFFKGAKSGSIIRYALTSPVQQVYTWQ